MLIEKVIDGVLYVEQRSYHVYRNVNDRKNGVAMITTSDEKIYEKHMKATFVNMLKTRLQTLVDRNQGLKVKCGYDRLIHNYIVEISPKEQYDENMEVLEMMADLEREIGAIENIVWTGPDNVFEMNEIYFEI